MAMFEKRIRAHSMRRKGESIKQIAVTLGVAKSTVSLWCRDISLTKTQKDNLHKKQIEAGHKGRILGAETNKKLKENNIKKGEIVADELISNLSQRDLLMIGLGLYWGEGTKGYTGAVSFTNTDPDAVLFARDWLECLGVTRDLFRPYIFIAESHKQRETELVQYWSKLLSIPRSQFYKVIFLKGGRKKLYENHNSYYGVLALRVRKSALLKYKILGLIKATKCRRSSVG